MNSSRWVIPTVSGASGTFDISISIMQSGTSGGVTYLSRGVPVISGINNYEVGGVGVHDNHIDTRYAVGGYGATQVWSLAYSAEHSGMPAILVSDSLPGSSFYGSVYALIPQNFKPGVANRWVMYMHGLNEAGFNVTCLGMLTRCSLLTGAQMGRPLHQEGRTRC